MLLTAVLERYRCYGPSLNSEKVVFLRKNDSFTPLPSWYPYRRNALVRLLQFGLVCEFLQRFLAQRLFV